MWDNGLFGNFSELLSYGKINVRFQKGMVPFHAQVLRNEKALQLFEKYDPYFEYNYETAEKWAYGELLAESEKFDPYRRYRERKINFNSLKYNPDDFLKLQTRTIFILAQDIDFTEPLVEAYDFDSGRLEIRTQKDSLKTMNRGWSEEEEILIESGLTRMNDRLSKDYSEDWDVVTFGDEFRAQEEYKYPEEEKLSVEFAEQLVLNQRTLALFRYAMEEIGDNMPTLEQQIAEQEKALNIENAIALYGPEAWVYDAYAYNRSHDDCLRLQTMAIHGITTMWQEMACLPEGINPDDFDLSLRSIEMMDKQKIRNDYRQGLYSEEKLNLYLQGMREIEGRKVSRFRFPKLVQFDND